MIIVQLFRCAYSVNFGGSVCDRFSLADGRTALHKRSLCKNLQLLENGTLIQH